jgi:deoxyadenosine/deoxycytidine kinase
MIIKSDLPVLGIVGPCGSGKSTLAAALKPYPLKIRHIAQEHSYVKNMWKLLVDPDLLIFLDASFPVATLRRRLDWTEAEYMEQQRRLEHARQHADLYILTDDLTASEVSDRVLQHLFQKNFLTRSPDENNPW